jgi:hypothetical protein
MMTAISAQAGTIDLYDTVDNRPLTNLWDAQPMYSALPYLLSGALGQAVMSKMFYDYLGFQNLGGSMDVNQSLNFDGTYSNLWDFELKDSLLNSDDIYSNLWGSPSKDLSLSFDETYPSLWDSTSKDPLLSSDDIYSSLWDSASKDRSSEFGEIYLDLWHSTHRNQSIEQAIKQSTSLDFERAFFGLWDSASNNQVSDFEKTYLDLLDSTSKNQTSNRTIVPHVERQDYITEIGGGKTPTSEAIRDDIVTSFENADSLFSQTNFHGVAYDRDEFKKGDPSYIEERLFSEFRIDPDLCRDSVEIADIHKKVKGTIKSKFKNRYVPYDANSIFGVSERTLKHNSAIEEKERKAIDGAMKAVLWARAECNEEKFLDLMGECSKYFD